MTFAKPKPALFRATHYTISCFQRHQQSTVVSLHFHRSYLKANK